MRFPSIQNVAKSLRDLSQSLDAATGPHEVHLRVTEDSQWSIAVGRAEAGPGHVGNGSVPGGPKRFASTVLARAMISEARADHDATVSLQKEMRATMRAAAIARRPKRKTGPFDIGEMVSAVDGQVVGRVVGHGTIYTQLGPVHVHMVELAAPINQPGFPIQVNVVPLADSMLVRAGSFTTTPDELTPVMVDEEPAAKPFPVAPVTPRPVTQTTPPPRRRARGTTARNTKAPIRH